MIDETVTDSGVCLLNFSTYIPRYQHNTFVLVISERNSHFGTPSITLYLPIKSSSRMIDAEDNPDPDHLELSEEAKAIKFEWTPELVKIGTSRGAIHPSIGPI